MVREIDGSHGRWSTEGACLTANKMFQIANEIFHRHGHAI
jgi:hypothetical protein